MVSAASAMNMEKVEAKAVQLGCSQSSNNPPDHIPAIHDTTIPNTPCQFFFVINLIPPIYFIL